MNKSQTASYRSLPELLREDLAGQTVLFRADLNIPTKNGCAQDDMRLISHKKSLRALSEKGARIAILSHFGRPQGAPHKDMSLAPIVGTLENILEKKVAFAPDCIGARTQEMIAQLPDGAVIVLENTRFHQGEEKNDPRFAAQLAELGSFYVNDAFSVAHRANASTEALAHILPAFAGFGLSEELDRLSSIFSATTRPTLAIAGGAKISGKINILLNLAAQMDSLVIGGAMANALLAAQKLMPRSTARVDDDAVAAAAALLQKAEKSSCRIMLPEDVVIATSLRDNADTAICAIEQIPDGMFCLDIGPQTLKAIDRQIDQAKMIIWNGPLGAYETPPFDQATKHIAAKIAERTQRGHIISIAGGGETAAAINLSGHSQDFTHISTAGGAFLCWLEGQSLPAIAALAASLRQE